MIVYRHIRASSRLAVAVYCALVTGTGHAQVFTTIPGIPDYGTSRPNQGPANPQVGDMRGRTTIVATAVSGDGSTIAGVHTYYEERYSFYRGCTLLCYGWLGSGGGSQAFVSSNGATTGLGFPANATGVPRNPPGVYDRPGYGTRESVATGLSADGRTVVGYGQTGCVGACPYPVEPSSAFIWTASQGLREIAGLSAGASTRALGVSGDGNTVVGSSGTAAFAWTAASGPRALAGLTEGTSVARAASFDGRWIAGDSTVTVSGDTMTHATLWGPDRRAVDLGGPQGNSSSFATDIAYGGDVVVGYGIGPGASMAFRWTPAGKLVPLGTLDGQGGSRATAVSGDGTVIVGDSGFAANLLVGGNPFRWTAAGGMQSISAWLGSAGVTLPADITLWSANDTNRNGNVVIGTYRRAGTADGSADEYAYLARVGDTGSGFLGDLDAFQGSVATTAVGTLDTGALVATGALETSRRPGGWGAVPVGDSLGCGWATASQARYRKGGPSVTAQEFGGCLTMGPAHLAAGLGRQNLSGVRESGRNDMDGRYALLGAGTFLGHGFEASITAYRGRFDGAVERSYANGAAIDRSVAHPRGHYDAAVVRLDGTEVVQRGKLSLSPYVAYEWSRTRVDDYAETGGGFPVMFGASAVRVRDAAAGAVVDMHVSPLVSWGIGLETRRQEIDSDGVPARVENLIDVSLPGMETTRTGSYALLRARYRFAPRVGLEVDGRTGLGSVRATDLRLALHMAF